jgi:diaminohydroxyphosphoribosylaminopyrimidine deaminase/5-amino-6-(5-phosphoribosylamino)uracil reductase
VGCVIVRDGVTLGEGWHRRRGEEHAEAGALRDARQRGNDVRGATAFVTLEPCDHTGATPPCSLALIDAGIARVVVGALDPNPKTAEGGMRRLRAAGLDVELIDDPAAQALVARFAWTVARDLPYITLKMAMSLDAFVTSRPGVREQLTGAAAQRRVQRLRAENDAVMVGAGTVRVDDPLLTVRPHVSRRKPYTRIVVCEREPIPVTSRVLNDPDDAPPGAYARTIVLAPAGAREAFAALIDVADVLFIGGNDAHELDLTAAMRALRARGITTVLCEGGPTLAGRLIERGLIARALWFVAPVMLGGGDAVPVLAGTDLHQLDGWTFSRPEPVGDDMLLEASACSPD